MKKMYITPKIEIFTPRIEKGFAGSYFDVYVGSGKPVADNGGIYTGAGGGNSGSGNIEGLQNNEIFF